MKQRDALGSWLAFWLAVILIVFFLVFAVVRTWKSIQEKPEWQRIKNKQVSLVHPRLSDGD